MAGIIFGMKIQGRILEDRRRICKDFFRGLFFFEIIRKFAGFFFCLYENHSVCAFQSNGIIPTGNPELRWIDDIPFLVARLS